LTSRPCTQGQFASPWYQHWCRTLRDTDRGHRKQWEFAYICQALAERGMLQPGRRGLGFGVGDEPLVSLFASYGVTIVATDLPPSQQIARGWQLPDRPTNPVEALARRGYADRSEFDRLVTWRAVDMNDIPADLTGFDFCWSSCALEHLGGHAHGLQFVRQSLGCLRPGGVAVHTTEFNLTSNTATQLTGRTVCYRQADLTSLAAEVTTQGYRITPDWSDHSPPMDRYLQLSPLDMDGRVTFDLGRFVVTSCGLIITKP
jgi:hypothetical protein